MRQGHAPDERRRIEIQLPDVFSGVTPQPMKKHRLGQRQPAKQRAADKADELFREIVRPATLPPAE